MNAVLKIKQKISVLAQQGKFPEAISLAQGLIKKHPEDIEVWWVLAQMLEKSGDLVNAIQAYYKVSERVSPLRNQANCRIVMLAAAGALWAHGAPAGRALLSDRACPAAVLYQAGLCWYFCRHYELAIKLFGRVIKADSKHAEALFHQGMSYAFLGENGDACALFKQVLALNPNHQQANRQLVSLHNYLDGVNEDEVVKAHFERGKAISGEVEVQPLEPVCLPECEVINIGLCSEDFRRHSVPYFLFPVLRNYPNRKWRLVCYSDVARADEVTREISQLCSEWVDVSGMSDDQFAERIRADGIHLLVDLMGYFGNSRLALYARRAAPVQMTWLGYPNTTGLAQMDFRLVDQISDPEGDPLHSEQLFRLPRPFLCFEPDANCPEVAPLPYNKAGFITFGSFNAGQKITETCVRMWSRILQELPESRLLLKASSLQEPEYQERMKARFARHGVTAERLILEGPKPERKDHLAMYSKIDIHLDTFPYNGTTTTFEAMWQGVPTVSLAGKVHRSRVGAAILTPLALADWVAETEDEYVRIALERAQDTAKLESLRAGLRDRLRKSTLCDGQHMVDALDASFREMLSQRAKPRSGQS